ncbi:regulator of chromosome condensation 1/beta-lactamase-inhibitor protein II [Jimgerdemannia flammicorona]|uniref:Regulator of chromosome condensation 1/beta-lactamase-inhibitor protein II n=1 Tax=Jimgerdemannia flammicorona TaxID=994334 RepID=A0A433Q1A2_9FUNG|nr:regulator of chromosome condensation 1/beta-lactamase-inhibitor protein II [Jimgerdemannia flammicorona]
MSPRSFANKLLSVYTTRTVSYVQPKTDHPPLPVHRVELNLADGVYITHLHTWGGYNMAITSDGKVGTSVYHARSCILLFIFLHTTHPYQQVRTWGPDNSCLSRTGPPNTPTVVTLEHGVVKGGCGDRFMVVLCQNNRIYIWGGIRVEKYDDDDDDEYFKFYIGRIEHSQFTVPFDITSYVTRRRRNRSVITDISVGHRHFMVLSTRHIYMCSDSGCSQLATVTGLRRAQTRAYRSGLGRMNSVHTVLCGGYNSFAFGPTTLFAWGLNDSRQIGREGDNSVNHVHTPRSPALPLRMQDICDVAPGRRCTFVLNADSHVFVMGRTEPFTDTSLDVMLHFPEKICQIVANTRAHYYARTADNYIIRPNVTTNPPSYKRRKLEGVLTIEQIVICSGDDDGSSDQMAIVNNRRSIVVWNWPIRLQITSAGSV